MKKALWILLVLMPLASHGQPGQTLRHPTQAEAMDMTRQQKKLNEFYRILTTNYLDTMNYGTLVEKGITSMLAQLDPHSAYLTAEEQKSSKEDLGGSFSGIGVEFNVLSDTIIVVNTIQGGPAEKVGVLPNDRIIAIDGASAIGIKRGDVPKYLRGPKGTKVAITVARRGASVPIDFTITRDDIPTHTVEAAYNIDPRTGYIGVGRFGSTTSREFAEAFARLGNIDGLILDLRGNGGGYLPEAVRMAGFFLNKGDAIVSTEGNMYPPQIFSAPRNGLFTDGRLIVLVDELSASASEIVAGAVQDWDRGIVVGRPTFGKGLVQREFSLDDGSALRITISRYLTPTGRAIQRPYRPGHGEEYYADFMNRLNDGEQQALDTTAVQFRTLRTGRPVYGSGGIYPDVYVASDTTAFSDYLLRLARSGVLYDFVPYYLDSNRIRIENAYPDFDAFLENFDAVTEMVPALIEFAASRGLKPDPEGLGKSEFWLSAQLKGLVARRLWDSTAYYRVIHRTTDEVFRRAVGMMSRWADNEPFIPVSEELVLRLSR